ncbi:hypothetical protein Poli38472_000670 [Pythium oligandrum]|uniref:Uncharacterized protein n=1 Tax=Pythium oligandrum TaxID=41045 RepID=A0A8K1FJC8_PYTOL|nr:hypothetical protein Poli38472_000670 [Pythium oligandrum]|eukprot:TMW60628.1 hypothetical protein Poli38472_000670 [Pythium oligandrum]
MKYTPLVLCAAVATNALFDPVHAAGLMRTSDATIESPTTAMEALDVAKAGDMPAGMSLTGSVEALNPPSSTSDKKDTPQEFWGGGLGWGGWGGWGGFGPYRFGWSCGGLGGWAYPLGYWNAFGAGLYGGGCGLGLAWGGLFYC